MQRALWRFSRSGDVAGGDSARAEGVFQPAVVGERGGAGPQDDGQCWSGWRQRRREAKQVSDLGVRRPRGQALKAVHDRAQVLVAPCFASCPGVFSA